jgi:FdhD protein
VEDPANQLDHGARPIVRYVAGQPAVREVDQLVVEEPLEIRLRGRAVSVTMRTPGHDEKLAMGFLLSEGLIRRREDVLKVEPCDRNDAGNVVNVLLAPDVHVDFDRLTRHVFASSSCGLCGKATIDAVRTQFPPVPPADDVRVTADALLKMPAAMRFTQEVFSRTGGLHAAALFSPTGDMLHLYEDVGRHNAVDKVIGACLLAGEVPDRHVLLVSGRASFEIMQKALAARVPIVAAVSAASTLAVDFATESGQTLVGFLRDGRLNVYAHAVRIELASSS